MAAPENHRDEHHLERILQEEGSNPNGHCVPGHYL